MWLHFLTHMWSSRNSFLQKHLELVAVLAVLRSAFIKRKSCFRILALSARVYKKAVEVDLGPP